MVSALSSLIFKKILDTVSIFFLYQVRILLSFPLLYQNATFAKVQVPTTSLLSLSLVLGIDFRETHMLERPSTYGIFLPYFRLFPCSVDCFVC